MLRLFFLIAVIPLGILGCQYSSEETPAQALQEIIQLYQNHDFDTLIRTRYAEINKAETDEQVNGLIKRFKDRYATDEMLNRAISTYRSALQVTPQMQDNGNIAIYNLEQGFIKLSRMENGHWGFHL